MKKWIFLGVLLLLVAAGAIGFYILSQPPKESLSQEFKEEAVSKLLGRKAQLENNVPQGNTEYKGKHVKFAYPAKALIYEYRESSISASLEDFSFDIKTPKIVFHMWVNKADSYTVVEDIPAVRLRLQRSYEYEKKEHKLSGANGLVFLKKVNGVEKSGVWIGNKKIYSFTVTGSSEKDVAKIFDDIISSASFVQ